MIPVYCAYVDMRDPETLVPNPRNPNQHSDKQIALLAKIIQTQGWRAPITISKRSGFVVRGHGRLLAALSLGLTEVPVDVQEYESEAAEYADLIADNRIAELSNIDNDLLGQLLADTGDFADVTGYSDSDIDRLIGEAESAAAGAGVGEDDFDAEAEAADIKEPVTQPGDIWELGDHRLICGDSTNPDDVKVVMDGQLADMIFTDPPYNVEYVGKTKDHLTIQNDKMDDDEFRLFLSEAFVAMAAVLKNGGAYYICHADSSGDIFRRAVRDSGLLLKQCLVWVKNTIVLGRQDYQWQHEPILYGWKPDGSHKFYGGRNKSTVIDEHLPLSITETDDGYVLNFKTDMQDINIKVPSYEVVDSGTDADTTIWRIPKPTRSADHPTMKPIALCTRGILNSSRKDEIVLEPFCGSGSTLIACEQTGRKCRAVEFDPVYCDVIVKRYINQVGTAADVKLHRGDEIIDYIDL